ncbi:condensation domain-containing protein [Brevibacillus daliensis]|uniref:condensation domain-containing protein n=1 Tax=Brevibacillus daliensis TaxID=2892995 RepID=UPI00359FEB79
MRETTKAPLQLINERLYRFDLLQISDSTLWMYMKCHHLISDGGAFVYAVNEIVDLYRQLTAEPSLTVRQRSTLLKRRLEISSI